MEMNFTVDPSSSDSELVASYELAGQFIDYLFNRNKEGAASARPTKRDWEVLQNAVRSATSLEQAVGRSAVVADLISRGEFPLGHPGPASRADNPTINSEGAFWPRTVVRKVVLPHKGISSVVAAGTIVLITLLVALVTTLGGSAPSPLKAAVQNHGIEGNAQLLHNEVLAALNAPPGTSTTAVLAAASVPPAPAPPSLADAPPLRPHEVFGFAPYWTLAQSAGFDVSQISTIAYFSIDINADGTLDESGPGWNGYQSQEFANLITRAHAAGDRVVLTATDFDQSSLNQLTSSPTAPATLSKALIAAIQAKNLDGVNLDLEGSGSGDQVGLTNLVTQVSAALHGVNPNYQVTMDTYASAAGDPNGFYNIRALAPAVDGFFVMAYQLNLQSSGSATSPRTSSMFSEKTAIDQYVAAAPASKVILGMPFFGIDWPTSDGTLTAQATGPATTVTYGQVIASGHPIYWAATTHTAWTSYEVGTQWHESFFEVPSSLYDATQLAASSGLGVMGIWALGMDGNDPALLSALRGFSPAVKDYSAGPTTTSTSSTSSTTSTTTPSSTTSSSTNSTSSDPVSTSTSSTSSTLTPGSTNDPSNPSQTRRPAQSTTTSSDQPSTTTTTPAPAP